MKKKLTMLACAVCGLAAVATASAGISLQQLSANADTLPIVYERLSSDAISGSNFELVSIKVDGGADVSSDGNYWGISFINLLNTDTRIRMAYETNSGWLWQVGSNGTAYLIWNDEDSTYSTYTYTNTQDVVIPANFSGTVYFDKTTLINFDSAKAYSLTGIRFGYDLRQSYQAKLAITGIKTATIDPDAESVSNVKEAISSFGAVEDCTVVYAYQGSPSSDVQTQMRNAVNVRQATNDEIPAETVTLSFVTDATEIGTVSPVKTEKGKAVGSLPVPESRWDYTFAGWRFSDGTAVTEGTTAFSEDTTLYAAWTRVYPWIFERTNSATATDAQYMYVQLMTDYASAPVLGGDAAEYWGIRLKNFKRTATVIRMGFEMGGGACCWIPGSGTAYYRFEDGATKEVAYEGQTLSVPGYFEGTIFVKKTDLLNYDNDTVISSNYRVKGIRIGYDFRQSFTAKLALLSVETADFTVGESVTISNENAALNLAKAALGGKVYGGTPSEETKDLMGFGVECRQTESDDELIVTPEPVEDVIPEGAKYVILNRVDTTVSAIRTGYIYYSFAMPEWRQYGENAVGTGNCIGVRLENVGTSDIIMRVTLRSNHRHRTGMGNNYNAYAWFLPDGKTEMSSIEYNKTGQYLVIPAGAAGTVYLSYETDFSWKGHTAEYGISHISFGLDLRSARRSQLVLKEVFDATCTVRENAQYLDLNDENDNAGGTATHFTTDVDAVNNRTLLDFRAIDTSDYVVEAPGAEQMDVNDRHDVVIICHANYNLWENYTDQLAASEVQKFSCLDYDPDDYVPVSLAVKTQPKTEYTVGDTADWSAGTVTLTYRSGKTEELSFGDGRLVVSGFDSSRAGQVLISVTLSADEEISTDFYVTISAPLPDEPQQPEKKGGCGSVAFGAGGLGAAIAAAACAVVIVLRKKKSSGK